MGWAPPGDGLSRVRLLLICLGGAVGTAARYAVGGLAARWLGPDFPYGTLVVNVLGSLLIGIIQQIGLGTLLIPETLRLALTIGVMGGFTTYSSFSYETLRLLESGSWTQAVTNIVLTTALCLLACGLGLAAGRAAVGWKGGF